MVLLAACTPEPPPPDVRDITEIRARVGPRIAREMAEMGLQLGAPIFVRIFKESSELEVWVRDGARFRLFRNYPICKWAGTLGPKLKEGDLQSPEGFYRVDKSLMNPNSSYHLAFNLGFPNAYDRARGRTGSFLMVHGNCGSAGCYAMTNPMIEEIYLIAEAALENGQDAFQVHAFPFRMDESAPPGPSTAFWDSLRPAYRRFEATHVPPRVRVVDGEYVIE
ncbi:MAG: 2-dehydro-3-deoxyphosphooctonate aldolase [Alphaproteobacteria bacterium]|nr:MAG: 2-dehydro-3-deoxyphosphooctonate aldolase [Alphaproteobacteria bacterium]